MLSDSFFLEFFFHYKILLILILDLCKTEIKAIGGSRGVFLCFTHIKVINATNQALFTELKNFLSFSRYLILNFQEHNGLTRGIEI